jgi:RNA polymerase sigma-54 factor
MLKTSLQLRLGQSLTLTPQLQQTIRLLQYSTLELQQQVQEMLEQNPMLDAEDPAQDPPTTEIQKPESKEKEASDTEPKPLDENQSIPDELALDTSWDAIYDSLPTLNSGSRDTGDFLENQSGLQADLREHLLSQLTLTPITDIDQFIGHTLILNISDDGYLDDTLENILVSLVDELEDEELTLEDVRVVQHLIMQLDPLGCCSINLRESLQVQLQHRPESDAVTHALKLVGDFFPDLEKQNLKLLTKKSGFSTDQIEAAFDLIRTLNPRPGGGIGNSQADYVVPDVYVVQHNEKWVVSLNPDISPRLRVHPFYSTLLKRGDKSKDNRYMRDQLQEARWFIKSIQSRNDTILRVAEVIVEKQQGYFEQGEEAMKPMVLRDVAETLGMHESTISRVTTQKYMLTPKGIVEFKYFFSSHLDTADGGNASATAIRAMIRSLISDENPQKPLSDSKITTILLQEKGIKVARRTVAKYREAMQISPSNERKRIA